MMADYQPRRRRGQQSDDLATRLLTALGRALWSLVTLPFRSKRTSRLDLATYRNHWSRIQSLASSSQGDTGGRQAIIEADKLLDQAFRELGLAGETFADRLRTAEPRFSRDGYNQVWEAHKLRNQIAHEVDTHVSHSDVQTALDGFRTGLGQLGAL